MKRAVEAGWSHAVLVCRRCSKRLDGGFGADGDERLARALRREPGFGRKRKARVGVVEIDCLGLCPKRAVVLVDTRRPDRWRLVHAGSSVRGLAEELAPQASPGSFTASPSVSRE